jgi:hypothetical protein
VGWKEDISSWANRNDREVDKVEKIAIREGWKPKNYRPSMKDALFDYLDKWYTLSIKILPEPATKNRRNPSQIKIQGSKFTKLSNGWKIWTIRDGETHSIIASNNNKYIEYANNSLSNSLKIHHHLVKQLRRTSD